MVAAELAMRLQNLKRQMGIDTEDQLDRILSYSGKTRSSLVDEWKPNAEKSITTRLAIEKLVEEGKVRVLGRRHRSGVRASGRREFAFNR